MHESCFRHVQFFLSRAVEVYTCVRVAPFIQMSQFTMPFEKSQIANSKRWKSEAELKKTHAHTHTECKLKSATILAECQLYDFWSRWKKNQYRRVDLNNNT